MPLHLWGTKKVNSLTHPRTEGKQEGGGDWLSPLTPGFRGSPHICTDDPRATVDSFPVHLPGTVLAAGNRRTKWGPSLSRSDADRLSPLSPPPRRPEDPRPGHVLYQPLTQSRCCPWSQQDYGAVIKKTWAASAGRGLPNQASRSPKCSQLINSHDEEDVAYLFFRCSGLCQATLMQGLTGLS